jgi:4-aminobutyrate aminotransferase/(S)-3-amino-2-methylpropionate transaminase
MRELGINIGSCGVRTIRLRPMLVFKETHIASLLAAFETASCRNGLVLVKEIVSL